MTAEAIVGRCLDAFELLSREPHGLPLTAIAQRLGLLKSSAHRLLNELQSEGFLAQDANSQHYRLTMRFPALGFRHLTGTGVVEAALPALRNLAEATGELVRMTVADVDTLTWVAKAQGTRERLRFEPAMGGDVRLHTTASGKVWLSSMSDEAAVAVARAGGFGRTETPGRNSIRTRKELLRQLHATRARGYGLAVDEDEPGMSAVAVNIPHPRAGHPVVGTVSVAGPTMRVDAARLESFVAPLRAAAAALGAGWPAPA